MLPTPQVFRDDVPLQIQRHDGVTILLHWLLALLVVALCIVGFLFRGLEFNSTSYQTYYYWHRSLGELTFFLAVIFLCRRARRRSIMPVEDALWRMRAASLVQGLIFVLLLLVPLSKIARGAYAIGWEFFGVKVPALLPANSPMQHLLGEAHYYSSLMLILLAGIHSAAAIRHKVVPDDGVLERMLPNRHLPRKSRRSVG